MNTPKCFMVKTRYLLQKRLILPVLFLGWSLLIPSVWQNSLAGPAPKNFADSIRIWRAEREERLLSDSGWLTIAGLYWLEPGSNRFGSDESNAIVFPEDTSPSIAGALILHTEGDSGSVHLEVRPDIKIFCNDSLLTSVTNRNLRTDKAGSPDELTLGRLKFWIIQRGDRWECGCGILNHLSEKSFPAYSSFPLIRIYRVTGRFIPYKKPQSIGVPNILGHIDSMTVPGKISFTLQTTLCSLIPLADLPADSTFFIIFSDETTGEETYGGGRFLSARLSKDGTVILDFNKAYNPPCAFNPYTTCPMPPAENRLRLSVPAGEMIKP